MVPVTTENTDGRCPTCGEGTLVDVSFDLDANTEADGSQDADSRQIETYSCGHTIVGPRLSTADQDALTVERRTSDETVVPVEGDTGEWRMRRLCRSPTRRSTETSRPEVQRRDSARSSCALFIVERPSIPASFASW